MLAIGSLSGTRALVTGGGGGIGESCARELAAEGAQVLVADKDGKRAERVAKEIGGEAWVVDLTDSGPLESLELPVDIIVLQQMYQELIDSGRAEKDRSIVSELM